MVNMVPIFFCLLFLAGLSGCVGQGTYEKKVEEMTALSRDLADMQRRNTVLVRENESLRADISGLRTKVGELDETRINLEQTIAALGESPFQRVAELEREKVRLREDLAKLLRAQDEQVRAVSLMYEGILERMKDEIAQGQVRISEYRGTVTVTFLNKVLFEGNGAQLSSGGIVLLRKITDFLKDIRRAEVAVVAFYDMPLTVPTISAQQASAWRVPAQRTAAVARQLRQGGVEASLLDAVTRGEFGLADDVTTRDGRDRLRRIDISITVKD